MKVVVVNNQDEILRYVDKKDRTSEDIIRVSGLWIFNSNGELLIAQRALDKKHDPGKWGPSVAGTVEEGETYVSNILKETKEELGVSLTEDELVQSTHRYVQTSHKYFVRIFFVEMDVPISAFKVQAEEVEQVKWISAQELQEWFVQAPQDFILSFGDALQDYIRFSTNWLKS
ncbi:MAG: NUDIX domain-containing protein [Patescibacteria group bacterium]